MRIRDPETGRVVLNPLREPPAPLLDHLRFIARAAVRRVYNDPRVTVWVERRVLPWLLDWNPTEDQPIRQHIGLKAGNEARRLKAMKGRDRTAAMARTRDLPRLVRGVEWSRLSDQSRSKSRNKSRSKNRSDTESYKTLENTTGG